MHARFCVVQPVLELRQVFGFGRGEVRMLQFHVMDAVAIRDHLWKIQDIERSLGIVRTRGALNDGVETQAHDRDAVEFCQIRPLPPRSACAGGHRRTDQELPSLHHTNLAPLWIGTRGSCEYTPSCRLQYCGAERASRTCGLQRLPRR